MLRALEAGHVGADLGNDFQRRRRVDAIDARQIDAAHPEQVGADIELRRVPRPRAPLGLSGSPTSSCCSTASMASSCRSQARDLTNVADVTLDHANPRAGTLQWLFGLHRRGIPPYISGTSVAYLPHASSRPLAAQGRLLR